MSFRRPIGIVLSLTALLAACDDDPTGTPDTFALEQCPAGPQGVNNPVVLRFNTPVAVGSVVGGNVIVSDAVTGLEVPGSISLNTAGDAREVRFVPSSPFRFDQAVRVRIQNLQSEQTQTQIGVTVCELVTEAPPIAEVFWDRLPSASGSPLYGVSLLPNGTVHAITEEGALFRRQEGTEFSVAFQSPFFTGGHDVDFLTPLRGFASFRNTRTLDALLLRTLDGAVTFDTIATANGQGVNITRLFFDETGPGDLDYFGVAGGGTSASAFFLKIVPPTGTFLRQNFSGTGAIADISFASGDTVNGVAVSNGVRVGTVEIRGKVFFTTDGGVTWSEVPGRTASARTLFYQGVARRSNGDIYVGGGGGYFARISSDGASETLLLQGVLANPDTTNPSALIFSDVEFAPQNDLHGFVIGKQLIGVIGGVPQYRGFIFRTSDGGTTWVRQGVRGAEDYGASFPGLNRLDIVSPTSAVIVGDAGAVFSYEPNGDDS